MKTIYSSCRICTNCGFEFQVENNEIMAFKPDVDHPHTRGYCCPKGIAAIEFQQGGSGHRLKESVKRGDDGKFKVVDTLVAAREVGEKLKAIVEEHGPRSVALFFGTGGYTNTLGNAFSKSWIHAIDSPNFFTTMTIDQSSHWITAGRMGVYLGGAPSLEDIDVGLLAGVNPLVSHVGWPANPMSALDVGERAKNLRELGQKLIVVDPRKSESAQRASLHLQLIPGEDATLFAGIVNLLFENDWVNREFCNRHVAHVEALRNKVSSFTPDYVSRRAGVPEEQLKEAARLLGNAKRPYCGLSTGTSMAPDSNLADFLVVCINVLCGGYRRAGDLVRNQLPTIGGFPATEAVLPPNRTWETGVKCRTQDIGQIFGEFPSALLPDEILVPGKDKIRALVVYGANPAMAFVDPKKTLEALEDLELLVTLDHRMTETAELSDYALATAPMHERHDLNGMYEAYFDDTYVQYFSPVVEKPSTVAHDWEVFWTMAKAMNVELELKHMSIGTPFEQAPSSGKVDMQTMPCSEQLIEAICKEKGVDFEVLKTAPRGISPELPEARVLAAEQDNGARLDVCPEDIAADLDRLRQAPEVESRYRLAVRRIIPVLNSYLLDSNFTRSKYPENFAYMNPEDIEEEGFAEGIKVEISTETGQILGTVRGDETIRRGVVSMTHCYGSPYKEKDSTANNGSYTGWLITLDPDRSEAINFMTHNTGIPISVSLKAQ